MNRLKHGHNSIFDNGIHLLSRKFSMVGRGMDAYGNVSTETYSYVDNFYLQSFLHYGIIFTVLFIIIITAAVLKAYKNGDRFLIFILIIIGIHLMVDDLQMHMYFNTFYMIIGGLLMDNHLLVRKNDSNLDKNTNGELKN